MRELKFRAWDRYDKEFAQNIDCLLDINTSERVFVLDDENGELIIEQYTGLKDKNGKEIYEGDIVRVSYGYNYEVKQSRTGAWRIGRDDLCVWADSSKVIGNIHENAELLEEEE